MRSSWQRLVECATVALFSAIVRAQLLDLSGPGAPEPGEGRAALALADSLDRDARAFAAEGTETSRAKSAWRRLAVNLLRSAEQIGPDASTKAFTARTLAARGDALDALIGGASSDEAWLSAAAFERLAAAVPAGQHGLDLALRDAIAPLLEPGGRTPNSGWFLIGATPPAASGIGGVVPPAVDELDRLLTDVGAHPAYAASVSRTRRLLAEASGVCSPPAWLSGEAGDRLERAWHDSRAGLLDRSTRREAVGCLERLAAWRGLLASLDDGGRDAAVVAARRAAEASLVTDEAMLDAGTGRTRALRTVSALLDDMWAAPLEAGLTPALRPAWARLSLRRLDARRRQMLDLGRVLGSPGPLTDPAVLSRFDACCRSDSALRGIAILSGVLTGVSPLDSGVGPPPVDQVHRPVADRLIELARELDRDDDTGAASAMIESLAAWALRHGVWPGEVELIRGGPLPDEMARIAGADRAAIVASINGARRAWLGAWVRASSPADLADAGDRMDSKRGSMSMLYDAATLAPTLRGDRPLGANDWPGFELSTRALRAIAGGLEREARAAWEAEGEPGSHSSVPDRFAPARLVATIERAAPAASAHPDPGWAAFELTAGAPVESLCWGVRTRDTIARFCRYAEEDAAGEDWLTPYLRALAAEALDEISEM